jgi:uridine kinase
MTDSELKPIIILLTGESHSGKSTTANALKSHHVHVIRGDTVIYALSKWCSDKNCCAIYHDYVHSCRDHDLDKHLNILSQNLNDHCAEKFVSQLIKSQYFQTKKNLIIMEGYVFGLPKVKQELCSHLKHMYYIWEMSRL